MAYYRRNRYYNRGNYRPRGRKLQHREWYPFVFTPQLDPANNANPQVFFIGTTDLKSDDCTILRTRGAGSVAFDMVNPTASAYRPAFTLGALTIPSKYKADRSNMPNPLSATDSDDWFLWQPFPGMPMNPTVVSNEGGAQMIEIDSKAKRKLQADESVLFVLGLDAGVGWGSDDRIAVSLNFRILVGY